MGSKSVIANDNKNSNQPTKPSSHVESSEELLALKRQEEKQGLKDTFNFLKLLAKKLKRTQATLHTAMVYLLKYTRIYSFSNINKFLVGSACFLLAAKSCDELVPIEYLTEWYIYYETKRTNKNAKIDISPSKIQEYSQCIQEQEFEILIEIGFDVEADLPSKYIAQFAATPMGRTFAKSNCSKYAYMFMNDSFQTTVALYYPAQYIAAACIYMAYIYITSSTKPSGVDLSAFEDTEWYKSIDETLDHSIIVEVKDEIKKFYAKKASSS